MCTENKSCLVPINIFDANSLSGGYESCLDLKTKTNITRDGEYSIFFAGKNVTIYCHQMDSSMPKEYMTLPSGEDENYSEIYGLRY